MHTFNFNAVRAINVAREKGGIAAAGLAVLEPQHLTEQMKLTF